MQSKLFNSFIHACMVMVGILAFSAGLALAPNKAAAQCVLTADGGVLGTIGDLLGAGAGLDVGVLCDNAIDGDSVVDESLTGDDIMDGSLTGDDIQDGSIGQEDLAADSVGSEQIQTGAVGTDELADGAVTTEKIADGAVTSEKLADGAVTMDALGNDVRRRIDENTSGVAIALALQNPDLVGNESFGISMNYGAFEDSSALGIAVMGVIGRDVFGPGDRLALSGGLGFGLDEDTLGGRIGAQLTW